MTLLRADLLRDLLFLYNPLKQQLHTCMSVRRCDLAWCCSDVPCPQCDALSRVVRLSSSAAAHLPVGVRLHSVPLLPAIPSLTAHCCT